MSLFQPTEISYEKQKNIILENVVKMLIERRLVHTNNYDKYVSSVIASLKDDDTCDVKVDNPSKESNDTYKIVLLTEQKISSATKSSVIGQYLDNESKFNYIIIVGEITSRAQQTLRENYKNIEIFLKKEMMFNLVESIYVPKHKLLSQEEADKLIKEYGLQKKELPRIFVTDPVSRYYNAKLGQIFRIIRPSETSGIVHYYRIVVKEIQLKK